jgi:hypothetical protein
VRLREARIDTLDDQLRAIACRQADRDFKGARHGFTLIMSRGTAAGSLCVCFHTRRYLAK